MQIIVICEIIRSIVDLNKYIKQKCTSEGFGIVDYLSVVKQKILHVALAVISFFITQSIVLYHFLLGFSSFFTHKRVNSQNKQVNYQRERGGSPTKKFPLACLCLI
jgi:hypothetical protein